MLITFGCLEVCHGQSIVDLLLHLGSVGGAEEVESLDIQLNGQEVGEVEAGAGLVMMN